MSLHHYVPCSLTRHWAGAESHRLVDPRGREQRRLRDLERMENKKRYRPQPLCVFDAAVGKAVRKTVGESFAERDLYALPAEGDAYLRRIWQGLLNDLVDADTPPVAAEDPVEQFFSRRLDAGFAEVATRLRRGELPADRDTVVLVRFAHAARFRTPAFRDGMAAKRGPKSVQQALEALAAQLGPQSFNRQLAANGSDLEGLFGGMVGAYFPLMVARAMWDVQRIIEQAPVSVRMMTAEQPVFLASDNPVKPHVPGALESILRDKAMGWGPIGTVGYLPISPTHCLELRRHRAVSSYESCPIDRDEALAVNAAIVASSVRYTLLPGPEAGSYLRREHLKLLVRAPRSP